MLRRYWFIVYPQDRFGPRNIGVSAYSKTEAMKLASETLRKLNLTEYLADFNEHTESIENIDIRLLDQNDVIPNMGVVTWKGVWWPNLNH